jgi:hypothetical protein
MDDWRTVTGIGFNNRAIGAEGLSCGMGLAANSVPPDTSEELAAGLRGSGQRARVALDRVATFSRERWYPRGGVASLPSGRVRREIAIVHRQIEKKRQLALALFKLKSS